MAEVLIPLGTKVTLNGVDVEFSTDCLVDVVKATSIDHAAEMGVEKALGAHLTHVKDGVEVSYVAGKRHERFAPELEQFIAEKFTESKAQRAAKEPKKAPTKEAKATKATKETKKAKK